MITNAMWFKSDGEAEQAQNSGKQTVSLKIGPISFTLQQVGEQLQSIKIYLNHINMKLF
jgi:hypothetical protein